MPSERLDYAEQQVARMPLRAYRDTEPKLGTGVFVDPTALVIGDVTLGDDVSIWPQTVLRGDVNFIRVGARSNIQDGSVVHVSRPFPGRPTGWPTIVGEEVVVGHRVVLHGCTIGNRCLVGIGAIVLDGVVVEDQVMIGAGSVVTPGKHLKSGGLYVGSPARRVRDLTAAEIERCASHASQYVKLKREYG